MHFFLLSSWQWSDSRRLRRRWEKKIWKWKIKFDIIFAWQPNARPQNLTALHPTTNFCLRIRLRCHNNGNVFRDMAQNVSATDEVFFFCRLIEEENSILWQSRACLNRAHSVQVVQLRPVNRRQSWGLVWMKLWQLSWWKWTKRTLKDKEKGRIDRNSEKKIETNQC